MLERVSWLSLILVCIINALFISYYTNSVISCASIPAINITAPTSYPSSLPTSVPTAIPTSTPTANPTFKSAWIEKDADAAYSSPSGGYGPYGGASSESTPCLQASLGQIGASGVEAMTDISKVCFGIGVVLVITAVYNLVNCFVVRIPVVYTKNAGESSSSVLQAIYMTASDGITLYHSVYLVLAVLSLQTNLHHIASILLLDVISKSKTTQETLMALWKPRRTIALAMLLMLLFNYIYAIFWVRHLFSSSAVDFPFLTPLPCPALIHMTVLLFARRAQRLRRNEVERKRHFSSKHFHGHFALGLALWFARQVRLRQEWHFPVALVLGFHLFHDVFHNVERHQGDCH